MTSLYNRILFHLAPLKLLKRHTGHAARRMFYIREAVLAYNQSWKAEFFRDQKENIREEIRREYDKANETVVAASARLEAENTKEEPDATIKESMEKTIENKKLEIKQFKEQIDHIDAEVRGYNEAIDSIHATFPLFTKYINE